MSTFDLAGGATAKVMDGLCVLRSPVVSMVGKQAGDIVYLFTVPKGTVSLACYTRTVTTAVASSTIHVGTYTLAGVVADVDSLAASVPMDATDLVKGAGDNVVIEISEAGETSVKVAATVAVCATTPAAGSFQVTLVCFVA